MRIPEKKNLFQKALLYTTDGNHVTEVRTWQIPVLLCLSGLKIVVNLITHLVISPIGFAWGYLRAHRLKRSKTDRDTDPDWYAPRRQGLIPPKQ